MLSDLRYALRTIRRSPLFAGVAVASLALGIGATTAVFSLVDAVAFRPLPFPAANRLVDVHETSATQLCAGCGVGTSYEGYRDWRTQLTAFDAMAAYLEQPFVLAGDDARQPAGAERVGGVLASANLFPMLGVRPHLGRMFVPDEDTVSGERVVVLGYELWRRRYGADSALLGRTVLVNGTRHTVVGVAPPRFRFPSVAELWVPLAGAPHDGGRGARDFGVVARLGAGMSMPTARAQVAAVARRLEVEHADTQAGWSADVTPLQADLVGENASLYWALFGAVAAVQLIVCANLAGLLLARGAARRRERGIRAALGASRWRLGRHAMAECLVIVAAGGAAGYLAAVWGLAYGGRAFADHLPFWVDLRSDWRVALACLVTSALTVLIVSAFGVVAASRADVHDALKDGGAGTGVGRARSRTRAALVVGELALTATLLSGAGLMAKTFVRLASRDATLDAERVITADVSFLDERYADSTRVTPLVEQVVAALARLPGIDAVGASRAEFLAGFGGVDEPVTVAGGRPVPPGASPRFAFAVTPGYVHAHGLRLVAGRTLNDGDRLGSEPVALVNETMARRLWPGVAAVGQHVKLGPASSHRPWVTIVGVVADPHTGAVARSAVYVAFAQWPGRPVTLAARARDNGNALVGLVRRTAEQALPSEPVEHVRTVAEGTRDTLRPVQMYAAALASLAALAMLIAGIGVYGIVSYSAAQRTREVGIRVALGATPANVVALFGAQATRLAAAGAALGLVGSVASTRVIRVFLFGTDPLDPLVLVAVTLTLFGVGLVASYLPARRAARVDPTVSLRSE